MDCTFGITGKDFVLVAADCSQTRSVITYKRDEDKVRRLGRRARTFACVLAAARVAGPLGASSLCGAVHSAVYAGVSL